MPAAYGYVHNTPVSRHVGVFHVYLNCMRCRHGRIYNHIIALPTRKFYGELSISIMRAGMLPVYVMSPVIRHVLSTPNGNHHNLNPNSETTAEQR